MNKKQKKERALLRNAQREQKNFLAPSKEEQKEEKLKRFSEALVYKTSEILGEKLLLHKEISIGEKFLLSYYSEEMEGKVVDIIKSPEKLEVKLQFSFKFKQRSEETQFLPDPIEISWVRKKYIKDYDSHYETLERRRWANEL